MALITELKLIGNLAKPYTAVFQIGFYQFQPVIQYIILIRYPCLLLEIFPKIIPGNAKMPSNGLNVRPFPILYMLLDIGDDLHDGKGFLIFLKL